MAKTPQKQLWIVVHSHTTVREDLAFALKGRYGATVELAANVRDTVEQIKLSGQTPSLIIVEDSSDIGSLVKYLAKNKMATPCILISDDPEHRPENFISGHIRHSVSPNQIPEALYKSISTLLSENTPEMDEEYCPIPTMMLDRVSPIQGDVFIRLREGKYIRLFATNDFCTKSDIEKYAIRKGVSHLYLHKKDISKFMHAINRHLAQLMELIQQKKLSAAETETVAVEAIDSIQAYVQRFGFTDEARAVAEKAVQVTESTLTENAKLSNIFKRFMFHQNRYGAVHSLVISHVATAISAELQWTAPGTLYKIVLAAIFHDITLPTDKLANVGSLTELEKRSIEFSEKECELFRHHPSHSAQVVEKFQAHIPPDVAQIIMQHHEIPDGSGFPRGLSGSAITPLSAVFIVAHEIVRKLLLNKSTFSMEEEFMGLVKKFDHSSTFHNILAVIDPYNSKQKIRFYG